MSRLDELIAELCPDGVEYLPLKKVAEFRSGWTFPKGEQGTSEGVYPFYKVADMNNSFMYMKKADNYISEETAKKLKCKPAPKGTIIFPKVGATMGTNKKRILTTASCYDNNIMGLIANGIEQSYLYYLISRITLLDFANGTGAVPSLDKNRMENYLVPVPPIEVQKEIVRILDNFTKLTAELTAELTARQKQYEFYRNTLLMQNYNMRKIKLSSIATYSRDRISATEIDAETYVGVDNLLQNKKGKVKATYVPKTGNLLAYNAGDILIGNIRPYLRKIWLADSKGGTNGDVLVIRTIDKNVLNRFLYYVLSDERFFLYDNNNAKGAKMPRGDKNAVMEYELYLPDLETQKRIVDVLDNFEKICNDLNIGLPAEIEARQKQYEYYRDKLLTFKEK